MAAWYMATWVKAPSPVTSLNRPHALGGSQPSVGADRAGVRVESDLLDSQAVELGLTPCGDQEPLG